MSADAAAIAAEKDKLLSSSVRAICPLPFTFWHCVNLLVIQCWQLLSYVVLIAQCSSRFISLLSREQVSAAALAAVGVYCFPRGLVSSAAYILAERRAIARTQLTTLSAHAPSTVVTVTRPRVGAVSGATGRATL